MAMLRIYLTNMGMALLDLMKKAGRNWRKKYQKDTPKFTADYYSGIDDLPLDNWIKCNDGDLRFVRRDIKSGTDEMDLEHWLKIYDEYINEFGLNKMYLKLLKAMQKRALLECDFIITRNRFKLTEIEMEVSKIEQMLANAGSGMTIEQTLIHLSKWMGTWINTKTITTREYFNLIKEYGKAN